MGPKLKMDWFTTFHYTLSYYDLLNTCRGGFCSGYGNIIKEMYAYKTGSTTERNAGQPSFNIMYMRNNKKGQIEISDSERFLVT